MITLLAAVAGNSRIVGLGWSWIRPVGVLWLLALVFVCACYAGWSRKIDVHAEGGPEEWAQQLCWGAAALVAMLAACSKRGWKDRLGAVWLAVVATLALSREFDLHERAQGGSSWLPPIRFRMDWWLDSAAPLGAKVFWFAVFALGGALLLAPPLITRAPTRRLLKAGDGATWLLLIGIAWLIAGYATDDLLGRGRLGVDPEVTQGIEEVFELLGVLSFLLATWYEWRAPLGARVAHLETPQREVAVEPAPLSVPAHPPARAVATPDQPPELARRGGA